MYTGCLPGACRDQERTSHDLELELWMVVIHIVDAANWMCEFRAASALNHKATFPGSDISLMRMNLLLLLSKQI